MVGSVRIIDDPLRGKVLSIESIKNSWLDCGGGPADANWADLTKAVTVSAWVKTDKFTADRQYIVSKGPTYIVGRYSQTDHLRFFNRGFKRHDDQVEGKANIQDGKWHLVTFVWDGVTGKRYLYIDAEIDAAGSYARRLNSCTWNLCIGGYQHPDYAQKCWKGLIDDVRIYDYALSARQIRAMYGSGKATLPKPADGTGNLPNNISLGWKNDENTDYAELYFGTDYYEVLNGSKDLFKGKQNTTTYNPGKLKSGTTYYWRVDQTGKNKTTKGYIWSFRTATEGYYMDFFKDSGLKLNASTVMPAVELLALSSEHISLKYGGSVPPEQQEFQNSLIIANEHDDNGVLLYPDGQPRFMCYYMDGGLSTKHGEVLQDEGRSRIRKFVDAGGSYSGSCAGAFITSMGTGDGNEIKQQYLHIWPGRTISAGGIYKVDYILPPTSPLLRYYDFGDDYFISNVQHWNGPYIISDTTPFWSENTELLTRFATVPEGFKNKNQGHVSIWAYKKNDNTGRVIPIASHPERITGGEIRDLMAAVLRYAIDGRGRPQVKALLENGVSRDMSDNNSPGCEKIGDKQYHHFIANIPVGTEKLVIELDGKTDDDLNLYAAKSNFAFADCEDVVATKNGPEPDEKITIENPDAGAWYISVKGVDTIERKYSDFGYEYIGDLHLLNGVPYSIKATWQIREKERKVETEVISTSPGDANLIAWWNFNDGTANDSSGNEHHGTFVGDAKTIDDTAIGGPGNRVLSLDGKGDYVNCGGGGSGGTWADMTTDEMTIACWLKLPNDYTNNYQPAAAKSGCWQWYRNQNGYGIRLFTNGANDTDDMYINYYPQGDWPNIRLDDGKWHHTAGAYDGHKHLYHIYIDGHLAKSQEFNETETVTGQLATSTYDLAIGARLAYKNTWEGMIDEVYLFDKALSHSEVIYLMKLMSSDLPLEP